MAFNRDQRAAHDDDRRRKERDLFIPPVENPRRRLACAADPYLFLPTYFPDRFYGRWTEDRRRIVDEIRHRARYGGDKALAAPRGEGKTSIAEAEVGVDCIVNGILRFPLITAATGPDAKRILSNIKFEYEQNEHLLADFPEVCQPIVALEGAPQRCNMQTVGGERTLLKWSDDYIRFPTVQLEWCPKCYWPEPKADQTGQVLRCPKCDHRYEPWTSVAAGRMLATRGLDSAVRGIRYQNERPDFCMIDDPETTESAKSQVQRETRETTIDKDLAGLGGPQRRVARLMLTTISRSDSLSARYTDPQQKPSWGGERIPLVKRWPDAAGKALWEQYIDTRREDQQNGDPHGRRAHALYVDNREVMDAGGIVSNETRFSTAILEDGTQEQLSTLQFVHDFASDNGWDSVFSELQNDPPSDAVDDENKLTPFKVRGTHKGYEGRTTGDERGFVPDGCIALTAFVDVQERSLYFEIVAWYPGLRRHVVDYGNFGDPTIKDRLGVEESIKANLRDLKAKWDANPCCGNDGAVPFSKVLVDSGHEAPIVYQMVREFGSPWQASKGDGAYSHPKPGTKGKYLRPTPDPLYESDLGKQLVLMFDATWWGHRCHDSFTILPLVQDESGELVRPEGCVTIFGKNPKDHSTFGDQICAQEWQMTAKDGKAEKWEWVHPRKDNHYFDCHVGNLVAGSYLGMSVTRKKTRPRITLSELQAKRKA